MENRKRNLTLNQIQSDSFGSFHSFRVGFRPAQNQVTISYREDMRLKNKNLNKKHSCKSFIYGQEKKAKVLNLIHSDSFMVRLYFGFTTKKILAEGSAGVKT